MIKSYTSIITVFVIFLLISNISLGYSYSLQLFEKAETQIIVGPFSQNQKKHSIIITWETDRFTSNNFVRWGETPECDNISYAFHPITINRNNIKQARISGLKPSSNYYYRVVSDGTESNLFTFSTRYNVEEKIYFCVYGDTRGTWDNWKNCSIVAKAIEKEKPQFVIHTGDIVNNGLNKGEWHSFFNISNFIHNSTLYPSLGNHENYGEHFFQYFNLNGNERWYSLDNGPVHFICLDSNYISPFKLTQNIWLINDLRTNKQPFTIVFFHYPLYSSGSHGSTKYLQWIWQPIFEIFDVDLVFNGHDHAYERALVNNVTYIVTGGGGAPLYDIGSNWWTQHSEKAYHYCYVTANQTTLAIETLHPDGSIIDSFKLKD
jgi:3',5'-cyclic AMP phosphodiesterase CpdA